MSIVAGLLMMAGSVISAAAPTATGERRVTVRFGDLDLTRADDLAHLSRRIVTAVSRACGSANRLTLEEVSRRTACTDTAKQQALAAMRIAVAAANADGARIAQR